MNKRTCEICGNEWHDLHGRGRPFYGLVQFRDGSCYYASGNSYGREELARETAERIVANRGLWKFLDFDETPRRERFPVICACSAAEVKKRYPPLWEEAGRIVERFRMMRENQK